MEYGGAPVGQPPWLARNARHLDRTGSVLRPGGAEELEQALAPLGARPPGDALTGAGRRGAAARRTARDSGGQRSPTELGWALRVADGLLDGLRTVDLLRLAGAAADLRAAAARPVMAGGRAGAQLPDTEGSDLLRDAVEYLRLRVPLVGETRTGTAGDLRRRLAVEDRLARPAPELTAWAQVRGCRRRAQRRLRGQLAGAVAGSRLRLVVSLHAAVADEWPETLGGLAAGPRRDVRTQGVRLHARPDGRRTAAGRGAPVGYLAGQGDRGARLQRVEIAASAALLVRWRPEETEFGVRLGVAHDVVLRWSERLCPPDHLWWINERAREKLAGNGRRGTQPAPPWTGSGRTGDRAELRS